MMGAVRVTIALVVNAVRVTIAVAVTVAIAAAVSAPGVVSVPGIIVRAPGDLGTVRVGPTGLGRRDDEGETAQGDHGEGEEARHFRQTRDKEHGSVVDPALATRSNLNLVPVDRAGATSCAS